MQLNYKYETKSLLSKLSSFLNNDCKHFIEHVNTPGQFIPKENIINLNNAFNNISLDIINLDNILSNNKFDQISADLKMQIKSPESMIFKQIIIGLNTYISAIIKIINDYLKEEVHLFTDELEELFIQKYVDLNNLLTLEDLINYINLYKLYSIYINPDTPNQLKKQIDDFVKENYTTDKFVGILSNLISSPETEYSTINLLNSTIFTVPVEQNIRLKISNLILISKLDFKKLLMITLKYFDMTIVTISSNICSQTTFGFGDPISSKLNEISSNIEENDTSSKFGGDNNKFIQISEDNIKRSSELSHIIIEFIKYRQAFAECSKIYNQLNYNRYLKRGIELFSMELYTKNFVFFYSPEFNQTLKDFCGLTYGVEISDKFFINFNMLNIKDTILIFDKIISQTILDKQLLDSFYFELIILQKVITCDYFDFVAPCSAIGFVILAIIYSIMNNKITC